MVSASSIAAASSGSVRSRPDAAAFTRRSPALGSPHTMPQLDRFLSVMVSDRADAIRLVEGQMVVLDVNGAARPMTKQPLTASQLVNLLREIAPADAQGQLAAGLDTTFAYSSADGAFVVVARQQDGGWQATLRADADGEAQRLTGAHAAIAAGATAP